MEESADTVSAAAKKPSVNGVGVTTNSASDDDEPPDDDKESVLRRDSPLIVRLPVPAPNASHSSVIVIDDSDDEGSLLSDVKPDTRQLDEQIVEQHAASNVDSAADTDSVDIKPSVAALSTVEGIAPASTASLSESSQSSSKLTQLSAHITTNEGPVQAQLSSNKYVDSQPSSGRSSSSSTSFPLQHRSSKSSAPSAARVRSRLDGGKASRRRLRADAHQQTEVVVQDASVQAEATISLPERQLESLRANVLQLLKTIVPTLTCSNLEFVDEIVVEMVRVNAESIEIDD